MRDSIDAWSAALVLSSEPKWLRHFFLCELTRQGLDALEKLVSAQPEVRDKRGRKMPRKVKLFVGDFNKKVDEILTSENITQKEATFCLLDQRTFECHWATLQKLASYKEPPNNKIELLYFLGVGWLHRALSGIRKSDKALKWWGQPNWRDLMMMSSLEIVEVVRKRFQEELGYNSVAAYPIFDRNEGNKVMYYMIYASDHDEAPALMVRAHHHAVRERPPVQEHLDFSPSS
jgi:three-Cys-motif partner protein